MTDPTSTSRQWTGRALDAGTWLLLLVGVVLLVRDRLVPAWEEREQVGVGQAVPSELRLTALSGGDTLSPAAPGIPTVYLIFQSTCPACERNLPSWRRLMTEVPGLRALAVGLEEETTALAYVRAELPEALAVAPVDRDGFVRRLGIAVVPTTMVVDGRGVLRERIAGVLAEGAVRRLVDELDPG